MYPSPPDRFEQIKECIARLETGWNHKNAYLWASAFTEKCEYIDAFGHFHHQWTHDQNARLHEKAWSLVYSNSRIRFLLESLEFLTDHIASVILKCELDYVFEEKEKKSENYITAVLEKQGQEWFVRHYQNTPVKS